MHKYNTVIPIDCAPTQHSPVFSNAFKYSPFLLYIMKRDIYNITAVVLVILIAALFSFDAITGFITLGGGETQGSGEQQTGNPYYGVIKGYVTYVLRDVDTVIESSAPAESIYVYFVPLDSDINWSANITCEDQISGVLTGVDADDSGDSCISVNYQTPTLYECTGKLTNSSDVTLYRASTSTESGNEGCFVSKTPVGSYDIYV